MPKNPSPPESAARESELSAEMQEIYRKLEPELRQPRANPEAIAAALEAAQRLAAENDGEQAADDVAEDLVRQLTGGENPCHVCGHRNREVSKFCSMCGSPLLGLEQGIPQAAERDFPPPAAQANAPGFPPEPFPAEARGHAAHSAGNETHHYHHHYHHHYFQEGYLAPRGAGRGRSDFPRPDLTREEKLRASAALRGDMSRAEAAVRRVTHEWVLACNTRHLDDLLELYAADALVLRSNYPPVRGAAAVREFFLAALEAGLGEVEIEPLRVEVVGDLAYEAGRCKALVPGATGKRREERGKYLWVCARQSDGEWKVVADCWSSDLSLTMMESDLPPGGAKINPQRKTF